MTKEQAKRIPELQINVDELTEECFYIKMALLGRISDEAGEKVWERVKGKYTQQEYLKAIQTATKMVENLDRYGTPCAAWCD